MHHSFTYVTFAVKRGYIHRDLSFYVVECRPIIYTGSTLVIYSAVSLQPSCPRHLQLQPEFGGVIKSSWMSSQRPQTFIAGWMLLTSPSIVFTGYPIMLPARGSVLAEFPRANTTNDTTVSSITKCLTEHGKKSCDRDTVEHILYSERMSGHRNHYKKATKTTTVLLR